MKPKPVDLCCCLFFSDSMFLRKITLSIILIFCLISTAFAEKPLAGIVDIKWSRPSLSGAALILQNHLEHILRSTGVVSTIKTSLLQEQLRKYNCVDDLCVLRFAADGKISLIIKGNISVSGKFHELELKAFGSDVPHNGKKIADYRVRIEDLNGGQREFSYILEEHAGRFLSEVFKKYRTPVYVSEKKIFLDTDSGINGRFTFYRFADREGKHWHEKLGEALISNGKITNCSFEIEEGDFILVDYKKQSNFLDEFYYGRKREIVLSDFSVSDSLYTLLFTVPASVTMPLACPLLGYYQNSDWQGLTLWAVNASPYLYMETRGLLNDPDDLRDRKKDVKKDDSAMRIFSLYMFFTGGTSLFVDAFSYSYLKDASDYKGRKPLVGNSLTAGYLSLISGGGGHFYRGNRFNGYCYFHINNILLYLTIREFCPEEKYDSVSRSYSKGSVNKKRAYSLLGAYGIFKTVEIIHAVLSKDRIMNGEKISHREILQPLVLPDGYAGLKFGLSSTIRF